MSGVIILVVLYIDDCQQPSVCEKPTAAAASTTDDSCDDATGM